MNEDARMAEKLTDAYRSIRQELSRVIVGQERVIEECLIAIFAQGHCLLEGVPGLAKTKLISALASVLSLSFNRIQFTPDLMPSDITGTEVIQEDKTSGERALKFIPGPVFANVILADEINRTPPKTQAALLEAMQEHTVTTGGVRRRLEEPFFVLATQNPIEQEGTYPLPEAQLDRFMFKVLVDYPTEDEELEIVRLTTAGEEPELSKLLSREEIAGLQALVRRVPCADHVIRYAASLARKTRVHPSTVRPRASLDPESRDEGHGRGGASGPNDEAGVPDFVEKWVMWGAGPRASQYMILGGKARALLKGRTYVSFDDVKAVAHPVLRHRVLLNYAAEAEGVTRDLLVDRLIETTPHEAAAAAEKAQA